MRLGMHSVRRCRLRLGLPGIMKRQFVTFLELGPPAAEESLEQMTDLCETGCVRAKEGWKIWC